MPHLASPSAKGGEQGLQCPASPAAFSFFRYLSFWGLMLRPAQTQPIHQLSLARHYGPTLKGPKPQHPLHSKAKNLPHFTSSLGL